jgi:hypothetical protein
MKDISNRIHCKGNLLSNNIQAKRCEYATAFNYYEKDSCTCNSNVEANGNCGLNRWYKHPSI